MDPIFDYHYNYGHMTNCAPFWQCKGYISYPSFYECIEKGGRNCQKVSSDTRYAFYPLKEREIFGKKWFRELKVSEWPPVWACLTLGSRNKCQHLNQYHKIR